MKHLRHAKGEILSDEQSRIHVRQVHKVLEVLDKGGEDVKCLTWKKGLKVWDDFCAPNLKAKSLTGNTIKTYLKSVEIFGCFTEKGDFYKPELLTDLGKAILVQLQPRMQDYQKAVHCRTAVETTTRDVDESYSAMTPEDLKAFEQSDFAKHAITLIGKSLKNHLLSMQEFTDVHDYLLVTMLVENGSCPGPLENAKVKCFEQATFTKSKKRWTLVVDEHKTTRYQGPDELVMDNRLYGYMKIYVSYIRPAFVDSAAEEALFIKDDGKKFEKGTIGRRVEATFRKAGVRGDIRVTSTRVRKIFSGAAFQ